MTDSVAQIDMLRHGETETKNRFCGSSDSHLSEAGLKQMWTRVEQTPMQWRHIITSPLSRCAHFAYALAERCNIPLTVDARLQEIHFGAWEGHTAADVMLKEAAALTRFWCNPVEYPPAGAEHLTDFRARVLAAWHDIQKQCVDQNVQTQYRRNNILLITHGGVLRVLYCHIENHPLHRLLELDVPYAAMQSVEIRRQGGGYRASLRSHTKA